jgi:hypothetical protein
VERNQAFLPNHGERYRHGERIASGFVESAVNQVVSKRMVKHQQMQWTQRGAHLLLQIRTHVLVKSGRRSFGAGTQASGHEPKNSQLRKLPVLLRNWQAASDTVERHADHAHQSLQRPPFSR